MVVDTAPTAGVMIDESVGRPRGHQDSRGLHEGGRPEDDLPGGSTREEKADQKGHLAQVSCSLSVGRRAGRLCRIGQDVLSVELRREPRRV